VSWRQVTKQLTCPHCGDVMAEASYRPLSGWLTITGPDGYQLNPQEGALHARRAEQEGAAASSPARQEQAQADLRFIKQHIGELMYDLPCHRGHHVLATAPQITRAVRRAKGNWAELKLG